MPSAARESVSREISSVPDPISDPASPTLQSMRPHQPRSDCRTPRAFPFPLIRPDAHPVLFNTIPYPHLVVAPRCTGLGTRRTHSAPQSPWVPLAPLQGSVGAPGHAPILESPVSSRCAPYRSLSPTCFPFPGRSTPPPPPVLTVRHSQRSTAGLARANAQILENVTRVSSP